MSISTSLSDASDTVTEHSNDLSSFTRDSSQPSSDYDTISDRSNGSKHHDYGSTCTSSTARSGSSGGGSLCSANISSDETSDDDDDDEDSFIINDDDDENVSSLQSTSESSKLLSEFHYSGPFDKSGTLTAFLTEYHDKPSTIPLKVSLGSSSEHDSDLLEATEQGDFAKIAAILKSGINANCVDKNGRTIMHIACSLGHIEIVKLLIEYSINVDAYSLKNKQTPLHETCIGGHTKILQLLLSEVADLDVVDHLGRSAAHYCAIHGESKCLEILCNHGCDICLEDSVNRTGVHFAAMNNHCDIIQILMERGADLDVGDMEGKTPTHYAARYGSIKALETLLKNAVDINQGDAIGSFGTHEAAYYGKLQCLKILLKKGVKCSAQDDKGRNILHKAAQGKSLICLHWILSSGKVDANSKDFSGNTGLHYAASNGFSEGYYCLVQHGASATSQLDSDNGMSPLDVARKHGKFNAIKKAVDGHCMCSLCGSVQPKHSQNNISRSKETLFKMPDSVRKQPSNSGMKQDNSTLMMKRQSKSNSFISTNSHFTLATKYYGPPI